MRLDGKDNDMAYKNRYIRRITIFLATVLAGGSVMAQSSGGSSTTGVIVKGNVYGGGNLGDVGKITKSADLRTFEWVDGTGVCEVSITSSTAVIEGNVFGAGKGAATTFECEKAMVHSSSVSIENGMVNGNVYGGGEVGRVEFDTEVTIGPESGTGTPKIKRSVFGAGAGVETHGYSALVRRNTKVTIQSKAEVGKSVYGGGEIASVGKYGLDGFGMPSILQGGGDCIVTVKDNVKIGTGGGGDVFGASKGVNPHYYIDVVSYADTAYMPKRMMKYDASLFNDSNKDYWAYYGESTKYVWDYFNTPAKYSNFLETLALATHPDVTITGNATVNGDVFGGGEMGLTKGSVYVKISGGTITKDVYGGGALANTNISNWDANVYEDITELLTPGTSIVTGYYTRSGAGTEEDPYVYTLIETANQKAADNTVYYRKGTWATGQDSDGHDIYTAPTASAQAMTLYKTNVILTGGTIGGNVYGGGLGQKADPDDATVQEIEAKVYGDVLVKLNEPTTTGEGESATTTYGDCVVKGSIFGCNNLNGSPQNTVTVHIWKTQGWTGHDVSEGKADDTIEKTGTVYELAAVYGGGNQAPYEPVNANGTAIEKSQTYTNVIIEGCDQTSIQQVYGGGNAASAPATKVTIESAYEIDEVFGGGNGLDLFESYEKTYQNPGANVGYKNYTTFVWDGTASQYEAVVNTDADTKEERMASDYMYGSGEANVNVYGGRIHRIFGGSNTKGNVRVTAVTVLDNMDICLLDVDEAYGGGKSAPMDAEAKLMMACIPGLKAAYGGAQAADVQNNVELNITNGTFDRVFGGNNISGTIRGSITLNIEETGCKPLIIGELYGGGNLAPYSAYGYDSDGNPIQHAASKAYADPKVNVKSFTSIGNVFGGGFGADAVMYGDPTVNISVALGKYSDKVAASTSDPDYGVYDDTGYKGTTKTIGGHEVIIPSHKAGKIGAIQNVFGGGNEAKVEGCTYVNIGTLSEVYVTVPDGDITVGSTDVSTLFTRTNAGVYEAASGTAQANVTYYKKCDVIGADIRGNVYGGGNQADVTGSTNVIIGKEATTTSGSGGGSGGN